jgi:nitrite reductase/ring-hydroxylating ferredoxin subunit
MNAGFHDAGLDADIPEGGGTVVQINGEAVFICRTNGVVYAMNNECPHAQAPLSAGRIRGGTIMCAAHGARFDLKTGQPLGAAFCGALVLRDVRIEEGQVFVAK